MDRHQLSWLQMARLTLKSINDHQNAWSSNPVYSGFVSELVADMTEFERLEVKQNEEISGVTKQKKHYREQLTDKIKFVSKRIIAFTVLSGDTELHKAIYIPDSNFVVMGADSLFSYAMRIVEKAVQFETQLADFGVTPQLVSELESMASEFHAYAEKPLLARSNRAETTRNLAALMRKINNDFRNKFDVFIALFKESHPGFYSGYNMARKVSKPRSSHFCLRGRVLDAETRQPIAGADVLIKELDLHLTSTPTGIFHKLRLHDSHLHLLITCKGYLPAETDIIIFSVSTAKPVVMLEKE